MKIYLSEIDEMTHDELATRAARMAKANDDGVLAGLSEDLRDAVDNERDSAEAAEAIRKHLETLA